MAQTVGTSNKLLNKGGVVYLLCFFTLVNLSGAQELNYSVEKDLNSEKYGQISIEGINEQTINVLLQKDLSEDQWATFFNVRVKGASRVMLGSYEVNAGKPSFRPRFLPDQSASYEITFSSRSLKAFAPAHHDSREYVWTVRFDELNEGTNEIVEIFPYGELLPVNILRLYVHFSNPVNFDNPHKYIRIEGGNGELVKEPFVELEEGLWSSDRRRLTLLIHPGRIKRKVGPNMTMGEVFKVGEFYKLIVTSDWDLEENYVKSFQIVAAIRSTIDVESWKLSTPTKRTTENLIIRTDRLLDKALSERLLSILDPNGNSVPGQFFYSSEKSNITFTPEQTWIDGNYAIDIDPKLEDVCGNTPLTVFDVEGEGSKEKSQNLRIQFKVGK
ncbi:MAG: hypothetical protein ABJG78_16170 [Cyclobacteriaceae bacterium]